MPRVLRIKRGGGDKLGAVEHGSSTDGQQEGDLFTLHHLNRLHQRFKTGVRLNTAERLDVEALEGVIHLRHHAVVFHAATAEGDKHSAARRNFSSQMGDLPLAEQNTGRGMQNKIIHHGQSC